MATLLLLVLIVAVGTPSAMALRRLSGSQAEAAGPATRATEVAVLGSMWALALLWLLALTHLLVRGAATALPVAAVAVGCAAWVRLRRGGSVARQGATTSLVLRFLAAASLLPVVVWLGFVLWRGWLVPPLTHDALAYHLPKAIALVKAGGWARFDAPDLRIATTPFNYELLLAWVRLVDGHDKATEWPSALAHVGFALASGAVVERFWGRGPHVVVTALIAFATPVVLLHGGAHKNDLPANFFFVCAALFVARGAARREAYAWGLGGLATMLAIGTKSHGVLLVPCEALVALWAVRRHGWPRLSPARVAGALGLAALAFVLLGGVPYADLALRKVHGVVSAFEPRGTSSHGYGAGWGEWRHLWMFPVMAWLAPFASDELHVWSPFAHAPWFWPSQELYFSHFGRPLSVLAALVPVGFVACVRRGPDAAARAERVIASLVALVALLLFLPIKFAPLGFFSQFPRFLAFGVPFVAAWTIAPLVQAPRLRAWAGPIALVVASGIAGRHAWEAWHHDRFIPTEFVTFAREHPGTRVIPFAKNRAASIVDRSAGPSDVIAVHGSFDTWSYPAWGARWSRDVRFIPGGAGAPVVPDDAQWVIVDRSWNAVWGHPDFADFGQTDKYLGRGPASDEDRRVINALRADPRWKLLHLEPRMSQAVFRRVAP